LSDQLSKLSGGVEATYNGVMDFKDRRPGEAVKAETAEKREQRRVTFISDQKFLSVAMSSSNKNQE
jgi:hypothetical protein